MLSSASLLLDLGHHRHIALSRGVERAAHDEATAIRLLLYGIATLGVCYLILRNSRSRPSRPDRLWSDLLFCRDIFICRQ